MPSRILISLLLVLPFTLSACWTPTPPAGETMAQIEYQTIAGDPRRGRELMQSYGCISCHTIAGVNGYNARVGPPLVDWADRRYIVGKMENTPVNLKNWLQHPQQIEPGSAMPDMNVTNDDAEDMVAYLFTLGASYEPLR